ncbi:hypothetical protein K435DRAFT_842939 [Dendrothele bispora CBS 962.96]|uniref:Cryptic loci regulator 2 N-terminal domain-containing protein n=1 Tax=Dendrothele bispora (strain CBS 962.96) TaxID=1314807 RepID=A0A4S8LC78_DENBC|nr:hypothetical protein K435DRAFT_842939 [Dendrothele bispora CBS 962.96]
MRFPISDGDASHWIDASVPQNHATAISPSDSTFKSWCLKLTQGVAQKLGWHDTDELLELPDGYRLFSIDRTSSRHRDVFLFGSPYGRFRSPNEFIPHAVWLWTSSSSSGTLNHFQCHCKFYHKKIKAKPSFSSSSSHWRSPSVTAEQSAGNSSHIQTTSSQIRDTQGQKSSYTSVTTATTTTTTSSSASVGVGVGIGASAGDEIQGYRFLSHLLISPSKRSGSSISSNLKKEYEDKEWKEASPLPRAPKESSMLEPEKKKRRVLVEVLEGDCDSENTTGTAFYSHSHSSSMRPAVVAGPSSIPGPSPDLDSSNLHPGELVLCSLLRPIPISARSSSESTSSASISMTRSEPQKTYLIRLWPAILLDTVHDDATINLTYAICDRDLFDQNRDMWTSAKCLFLGIPISSATSESGESSRIRLVPRERIVPYSHQYYHAHSDILYSGSGSKDDDDNNSGGDEFGFEFKFMKILGKVALLHTTRTCDGDDDAFNDREERSTGIGGFSSHCEFLDIWSWAFDSEPSSSPSSSSSSMGTFPDSDMPNKSGLGSSSSSSSSLVSAQAQSQVAYSHLLSIYIATRLCMSSSSGYDLKGVRVAHLTSGLNLAPTAAAESHRVIDSSKEDVFLEEMTKQGEEDLRQFLRNVVKI